MAVIAFDRVDVIFGRRVKEALALLDAGADKDRIFKETGHVVGVQDASLEVEAGEIFVLMGLSGSGKSTLLRCVNGLNRATRGRVLIDDDGTKIDVTDCDPKLMRRLRMNRVSMVFQQFALMPWRTIGANVALGLEVRGVPKAERRQRVAEVLEQVGLGSWLDHYPHELSGGMQQRVGLARAFATDAEILLMDEPFSALDPLIRERLQDELLELQRTMKRTILFVSHDLDEALKVGSRIAIMEGGRIIQVGPPEKIVTEPADEYVRQFVANVNPLNVLRGITLMRPLAKLRHEDGVHLLDEASAMMCRLDADGRPAALAIERAPARLVPHRDGLDLAALGNGEIVAGSPETTMRTALEVRHETGRAMPLLDGGGRLIGVIGAAELLAAMVHRGAGPAPPAGAGTTSAGPASSFDRADTLFALERQHASAAAPPFVDAPSADPTPSGGEVTASPDATPGK